MSHLLKSNWKTRILLFLSKGFIVDFFLSYRDLKQSFDLKLKSDVNESRLLAYSFFISFVLFLQRLPYRLVENPENFSNTNLSDLIGIDLFASLFFVPIFLYIIASFLHILCLPFKTEANFFQSRLAFFWSTVLYAPLLLLLSILETLFFDHWIAVFFKFMSISCYSWIFSTIFCRAHKFPTRLYLFLILIIMYLFFALINFF